MKVKRWYESRTNWVGIIMMLVAISDAIMTANFSAMTIQNWIVFGLGIVIIVLRSLTDSKIGKSIDAKIEK